MFADDLKPRETQSKFQKTQFLTVIEKQPSVVRFLSEKASGNYVHYVNRATVRCLGDACPLCMNNRRIVLENPEDYRNVRGFHPSSARWLTNVLDRTIVKVCPECGSENRKTDGRFTATCWSCNALIGQVEESISNKVKVFSFGVRVKDKLNALAIHPIDGTPVDLTSFDIGLVATGAGKEKDVNPVPMKERNDAVEVDPEQLYDLTKVLIELAPEEMLKLSQGVSLKDLFAARKVEVETVEKTAEEKVAEDVSDDLMKRFAEMYPN